MGFAATAKAQQSRFRDISPTISSVARTPTDPLGKRHRHLLALGHEEENLYPGLRGPGGAMDFFRARGIKWWRSGRRAGDAKGDGPTRNLTSSQVSCVNFLLPLAAVPSSLLALLRTIDEDVIELGWIEYPSPDGTGIFSSLVEFEWAGLGTSLEGEPVTRGAHVTNCDALLVAVTRERHRRAYLVEWKYAERYEPGRALANDRRRARYSAWHANPSGSLQTQIPLEEMLYDPVYQIARLAFLGDLMVRYSVFGVTESRVLVVCPAENRAYRETITSPTLAARFPQCDTLELLARQLWRRPGGFHMRSQADLLAGIRAQSLPELAEWDGYHHERYGW
jgi:hypothetical protein